MKCGGVWEPIARSNFCAVRKLTANLLVEKNFALEKINNGQKFILSVGNLLFNPRIRSLRFKWKPVLTLWPCAVTMQCSLHQPLSIERLACGKCCCCCCYSATASLVYV